MRLLVASLFFSSTLFSTTIEMSDKVQLDPNLKQRFENYWAKRGEGIFDSVYDQELPYLRYLHSRSWYKNFFANAPKFKKVVIKRIHSCTKNVCILGILLFKDSSPIYLYDKWIKINGKWYHRFNDSPLPVLPQ